MGETLLHVEDGAILSNRMGNHKWLVIRVRACWHKIWHWMDDMAWRDMDELLMVPFNH